MLDRQLTEARYTLRQLEQQKKSVTKQLSAARAEAFRNAIEIARLDRVLAEKESRKRLADGVIRQGYEAMRDNAGTPEERLALYDAALTRGLAILDGKE